MKTFLGTISRETEKAVMVETKTELGAVTYWMPKSQIEAIEEGQIKAADWLVKNFIEALRFRRLASSDVLAYQIAASYIF